jgi:hypothetical protein
VLFVVVVVVERGVLRRSSRWSHAPNKGNALASSRKLHEIASGMAISESVAVHE